MSYILDAIADQDTRRSTAQIFRSLIPPQYLLDDMTMDIHLRCVFVESAATTRSADGAYNMCRMARDVLFASGYLSAVIVCCDRGAGVLVYDDTETTEMLSRRAPRLLHQFGLQMHESSEFPFLADPADREAALLLRLLPPYISISEECYRCRVLLLTGLDTHQVDAAEIAYAAQHRLDLIYESHGVEAVIIHRCQGVALVVLGSSEDMEIILQEPPETWVLAFGQKVAWVSIFGCPVIWPRSVHYDSASDAFEAEFIRRRECMGSKAFEPVRDWIIKDLVNLRDDQTTRIARCFVELCALPDADVVLRGNFQDRSLLLSGIAITWLDLCSRLSTFGMLDDLVQDDKKRMALVVFRSWHGAARLRREPPETWARLGFLDCRLAPGAEHASFFAERVRDLLLQEQDSSPDPLT